MKKKEMKLSFEIEALLVLSITGCFYSKITASIWHEIDVTTYFFLEMLIYSIED